MPTLTFDEFFKARKAQLPAPRPSLDGAYRVNAALLACKRLAGLPPRSREAVAPLKERLQSIAASGASASMASEIDAIIADLKALGVQVLDADALPVSDRDPRGLCYEVVREDYKAYLDAEQMKKRELALAEKMGAENS